MARSVVSEDGPIMETTSMKASGKMTCKMAMVDLFIRMEATLLESTETAIDLEMEGM